MARAPCGLRRGGCARAAAWRCARPVSAQRGIAVAARWPRRRSWRRSAWPACCRSAAACPPAPAGRWLNTPMRSLIDSASCWSWVTKRKVMPSRRCSALSSLCICSRSFRSSAPSGSSSSSTCGWLISARARATRWRWPPDSCAGRRSPTPGQLHQRQQLVGAARRARPGPPCAPSARRPRCRGCSCAGTARSPGTRCSPAVRRAAAASRLRRRSATRPAVGQREAADHAQAGGLARARRPEQGEELAARLELTSIDAHVAEGARTLE